MTKWIVDSDHSVAAFSILHMMIARVRGQFNNVTGVVFFDPQNIAGSSVELTIGTSSVVTGVQKRDDHLKSPDFLDVVSYPEISFQKHAHRVRRGKTRKRDRRLNTARSYTSNICRCRIFGSGKRPFWGRFKHGFYSFSKYKP